MKTELKVLVIGTVGFILGFAIATVESLTIKIICGVVYVASHIVIQGIGDK